MPLSRTPGDEGDSWESIKKGLKKPFFPKNSGFSWFVKDLVVMCLVATITAGPLNQSSADVKFTRKDVGEAATYLALISAVVCGLMLSRMKLHIARCASQHSVANSAKCECRTDCPVKNILNTSNPEFLLAFEIALPALIYFALTFGDFWSGLFIGAASALFGSLSASAASALVDFFQSRAKNSPH